jgi:hypothetical protein
MASRSGCGCVCHRFSGILVALIGVDFLLGHYNVLNQRTVHLVWPILVVLIGLKTSMKGMCKCCNDA